MANVIKTVLTYQLDGSNRDFNIPFEYLARKFVVVTLIGVDRKVLTLNTDYRFATRTTISLTKSWGPADGYTTIELRRVTSTTDRLVDFTDGSILRAYDLNVAQIQTMHVAEEARDLTADTIGVNNDGHLDARGRRIVNLANAVDDRDAVPFGQLKTMNQNSWQARNEALQFRNEAETFRNQAEGFKNESSTNATNTNQWRNEAEGFRDEAEQFKNTATQQATAAGNSAAAAHQSEVNAANSAAASANSATLAEQQADRAEREADKLGNWNALAGAIKEVDGYNVTWRGAHILEGSSNQLKLVRISDDTSSYIQGSYADGSPDWYLGKLGAGSDIALSRLNGGTLELTNSGFTRLRHGSTGIKIADGGIEYTSPSHTFDGGFRTKPPAGYNSHTVYVGGTERNELRLITDTGSTGTFINALNGDWYDCWWKIGGVRGGGPDLPSVDLWVYNTGTNEARYTFGHDGSIRVNNSGFNLTRDGDIWGTAYGSQFLTTWVKTNFATGLVIGARSFVTLPGGWYDTFPPAGHTLQALNLNDGHGVHGVYYSPLWLVTMSGARRLAVTE